MLPMRPKQNDTLQPFDYPDSDYLARNLSVRQLRHEIQAAGVKARVAEAFCDTEYQTEDDLFPWADYAIACHIAIDEIRHNQPRPESNQGYIDTEAIKAKSDIVTTVEQYTKLRKAGRIFTGCCPIHQDKNPSLMVYPDQQTFHCFGCNRGGDVIAFIQAVENTDFKGAVAILRGK